MENIILFKAKRLDNGEWVSGGSLITFLDNGVKSFFMPQFNEKCTCEHDNDTDDILSFSNCRFYKVNPETLCQFTGLHDKKGNKIWENDIIESGVKMFVSWHKKYASWCLRKDGWYYSHFFSEACKTEDCEVIGNKFDNPELLEEL